MVREVFVSEENLKLECTIKYPSIDDSNRMERVMRVSELLNKSWKLDNIDTVISEDEQLIIYNLKK